MENYINDVEAYNVKMNGEVVEKLQARFDRRASFYGKAEVIEYNNILYLKSYDTIVAKIENGKAVVNGWYSQTTARHINEFLKQNNFEAMSKKEMEE
jgi:ArsR family metal-binding transcriptional regulator